MSEKETNFADLSESVILDLKALGYMDSTLTNYRRFYARLEMFMKTVAAKEYSSEIGKAFIELYYPADTKNRRTILTRIRRLDDHLNKLPYKFHRNMKITDIPTDFVQLLDDYLAYCDRIGNKSGTIEGKKSFCLIFLKFLAEINCKNISEITAEVVAKSCLKYRNKDGYAVLRQFLKYLFEHELIPKDISMVVPHFRRKQIIPSIFTPEEIKNMEETIDTNSMTGKRDIAILLLITRLGLRSGDVASLKLSELDFSSLHINLIQEKTGKPLSVFMTQDVLLALKTHIENSSDHLADGYVFHSMYAPYGRITTSIIRHIVNNCIISANIDVNGRKHGPHALRSSLASSLVSGGVPYDTVRKILGHSDPDAIKHYVKTDIERLRCCAIDPPEPAGIFFELLDGRRQV